jgi:nitrogen fixation NifU-like protein
MDELYRSELMEIYKDPSFRGQLNNPSISLEKHNPFCGDRLQLFLQIEDGLITDAKFKGDMCFVSLIGAEFLLAEIVGQTIAQAKKIDQARLLELIDLNLSTSRVACATLTLQALHEALAQYERQSHG